MSGDHPHHPARQFDQEKENTKGSCSSERRLSTSSLPGSTNISVGHHPGYQRHLQPAQYRICKPRSPSVLPTTTRAARTMNAHQRSTSSSPTSADGRFQLSQVAARRAVRNPALHNKLRQMALPLAPLVQVTTGEVHEAFPGNLLAFWLLTDKQLDALAAFYHQQEPSAWTLHYPCPIVWRPGMTIEEKRRKMGKFIGLRGCETPIAEWKRLREEHGEQAEMLRLQTEEEIMAAARTARQKAQEEQELFKRKMGWY